MIEVQLDRRTLFGTGAGLLAFTALPAYAKRARFNNLGWDKVQAMFDGYIAEKKVPGLVAAVARFAAALARSGAARRLRLSAASGLVTLASAFTAIAWNWRGWRSLA